METIARLRELLAKATPGPWRGWSGGIFGGPNDDRVDDFGNGEDNRANRALIVDAVNALPALLDRLEAAEGVVEAARAIDRAYSEGGSLGDTFRATAALHAALRRYDEVPHG